MKKWLFTWFLLIVFPVLASHIVGGEFELLHIKGNTYQINMILYFDKYNGDSLARDPSATVNIFSKSTNEVVQTVTLPLTYDSLVQYTNSKCAIGSVKTARLVYTATVTLNPSLYSDPMGYYMSWQRCCRNYTIVNVYSQDPNSSKYKGKYAGQTFYLEFPPLIKNGQPFYNSSPRLFPPLSDYAAPNTPYYVDFSGIDDDNDSLVYSLVTPLSTTSDKPVPDTAPAPYPDVQWRPGYDLDHILKGHPDLRISPDGLLTFTPPSVQGLFVFAVKVEQFRSGEKIGESRRDFQVFVTDTQVGVPPKIVGKTPSDPDFRTSDNMILTYPNTDSDADRCITVRVSDDDSKNGSEVTNIRIVPLNFSKKTSLQTIGMSGTGAVLTNGSTQDFTICFPACPIVAGPMKLAIIVFDDACALPLLDTLFVTVTTQPPDNTPPHFSFISPQPAQLQEGDSQTMIIEAVDNEPDSLIMLAAPDHFALAEAGMTLSILESTKGHIKGQLKWDAFCDIYDFTHQSEFPLRILVDDLDKCNADAPISTPYTLSVQLPSVDPPIIDTDLTPAPEERKVTGLVKRINESLIFDVTGKQAQGDQIFLTGTGIGFDLAPTGVVFTDAQGTGAVTSHFRWDIKCGQFDLKQKSTFEFQFILVDPNKCRFLRNDTVTVEMKILPPENAQPALTIQSQNALTLENNQMNVILGQSIALGAFGNDPDGDNLNLTLLSATGNVDPEGYIFADANGIRTVNSPFSWDPSCTIFKEAVYANDYVFTFALKDDKCFNEKGDTVAINVHISDVESGAANFYPTNVITPNGDGCNDFFAVEGIDPLLQGNGCTTVENADSFVNLPKDNCAGTFQYIRIFNRWGKQVFESTDRKFRWYAQDATAGVYYYYIHYGNAEYKGALSVRF